MLVLKKPTSALKIGQIGRLFALIFALVSTFEVHLANTRNQ